MTVLNRMDELSARIISTPTGFTGVDGDAQWAAEIRRLARLRGATVLAHNYQLPAIQDVADHVGTRWRCRGSQPRRPRTPSCSAVCTSWPRPPRS